MSLKVLKEMPPWEWPEDTGKTLLGILLDDQAPEPDRVLAAELAGDYTVINDERTTDEAHAEHAGELPVLVVAFDEQILEALDSKNGSIHYEAAMAAGSWELDEAWPHVAALLDPKRTDKALLLAAIEAAASIRPGEAAHTLIGLTNSSDDLIGDQAQQRGGGGPNAVIPGLPARAEPGIQRVLGLDSGFRVPLRGPGMTS